MTAQGAPAPSRDIPPYLAAGDLVYRTPPDARFVRGEGVRLYDTNGRPYLDAEAANGTLSWGYDASLLTEACRRALPMPALPSFCESELRLRVVQRLADRLSAAVGVPGRVALELGGAQGIEMAMRIVAANRGGGPVLVFQGAYHGRSPFTAHLSASARYRSNQPWPGPQVVRLPYPDCRSCPHRPAAGGCNPACAAGLERLGTDDCFGLPTADAPQGTAAFLLEPMLNVGGCVVPDPAHVRRLTDHVRSLGGLIVVDEIFTGLHRLGPEWGFQLHGIQPDIVVASKALTNGALAFSCVWAREPLASPEVFPPGSHSSTFAGSPLGLAVVDTVLDRWDAWHDVEASVGRLRDTLAKGLSRIAESSELVRAVDVLGGVARVTLSGPYATRLRALAAERPDRPGLLLASTGMAPATVVLHPPLVTSTEDAEEMTELLGRAVDDLEREL
ncbi:aminotransferase class III-fold pyridoxal phosphate-dependent enzyme [Kitasatospora phosalacinea]|uniref:aminotransferase class III-fold pyridoxal phosphate-dependent enzyme n=1 Tax=Kitasatospora phosalacinea TaxID=2065 RepID=UPI0035D920E1